MDGLELARGEIVLVMGPSGSGKTTLHIRADRPASMRDEHRFAKFDETGPPVGLRHDQEFSPRSRALEQLVRAARVVERQALDHGGV